jgi:cytochrome c553
MLLATACMALAGSGSVQGADNPPASAAGDLKAIYAGPQEVAEGRGVAEKSCSSCHGMNGIATAARVPHIAGQRAAYLHLELRAYQGGGRADKAMEGAVKFLSDDALSKVAAYYASLDPPPAAPPAKGQAAKPDPLSAGKGAAAGCSGCHGEAGVTQMPGTPSLVGLDPQYLVASMQAYKHGERKNDMMKTLVSGLSDADMKSVALFYALQKADKAATPAAGDQAAGKTAAAACSGCHGEQGVSGAPATPSLAGQDAQYLAAAVQAYRDGSRGDATMKGVVAGLDEKTIKDLGAFYAAQQPQAPKVSKPLSTSEWAQRCDRCHGVNGNSTDPRTPALAAQRQDYLERVLVAYKKGDRKSSQMAAMSHSLSEEDIAGLAAYYARQKGRSVVYVPAPAK